MDRSGHHTSSENGWTILESGASEAARFPAHATGVAGSGPDPAAIVALIGVTIVIAAAGLFLWTRWATESPYDDADASRTVAVDTGGSGMEDVDDRALIRRVLRDHGGRTRQSTVVEETGWSKAKVSSVLAEMADDGAVSKIRVGRENIVCLPGHEPDAVGSPLEE